MNMIIPVRRHSIVVVSLLVITLMLGLPSGISAASSDQYDQAPTVEWTRNYSNSLKFFNIRETAAGFELAGITAQGAIHLSQLDTAGQLLHTEAFYLTADNGKRVIVTSAIPTSDDGFLLIGNYPEFYYHSKIPYVVKLDAEGAVEWSKDFLLDTAGYSHLHTIKQDDEGNYYYVLFNPGEPQPILAGKLDSSGQPLWEKVLPYGDSTGLWYIADAFIQQGDSGGEGYVVSAGNRERSYVWRLSDSGDITWSKRYSGMYTSYAIESRGGGYTILSSEYHSDTVLRKTDASGNVLWSQNYGVLQAKGVDVEQTDDNGYLISMSRGVIKTDEAGNMQWSKWLGESDWVLRVLQAGDGGILLMTESGGLTKLSSPNPQEEVLEALTFDSESYSLSVGDTLDTVVTAVYSSGEYRNVTGQAAFASADPSILSIDGEGNMTGHRKGQTTVTANYSGYEAVATVFVYGSSAPAAQLLLDSEDYSLVVGQTLDTVVTYQAGQHINTVTRDSVFTVLDPSIVHVDEEGNISGLKKGRTTLIVNYNGMEARATIDVY